MSAGSPGDGETESLALFRQRAKEWEIEWERGAPDRVQPGALEDPEAGGEGEAPGRDHGKPQERAVPANDVETGSHQSCAVADAHRHAD